MCCLLKINNNSLQSLFFGAQSHICLLPSPMPTSASCLELTVGDLTHREDQSLLSEIAHYTLPLHTANISMARLHKGDS